MPIVSVTTTARDVFSGDVYLESLSFKNGSLTGILYFRNTRLTLAEVTSADYEFSLGPGGAASFTQQEDGDLMRGPWRAISDTAGGVTVEITPGFNRDRRI